MLATLSLQPNSHFLGPHSFLVQSDRAMKMKNHIKKWEHSKDLFLGWKVEQLGFFFQNFLFCCLNKLAKISKILAHLVDFTQGKVESFQEKSNFFV